MKIKVKSVTKEVPLLVDPEPGYMSLVNHGANQTPWNSLKSLTGERQEQTDMAVKGKGAKRAGIITRINFSKDNFADEAAVQKYLDDNQITDCVVVDETDIFAAKSTDLDKYELDTAKGTRTKHAGVTMFVAEIKGDKPATGEGEAAGGEDNGENVSTDEKPATKAATKVKVVDGTKVATEKTGDEATGDTDTDTELRFPSNKYDYWASMMSNEGSLLGVLKDGTDYDGLPPGMDEVIGAVYYSAGNVLSGSDDRATKETKIKQIGEDFATITMGLFELFEQATEDATKSANTERKAKAAKFVETFSASVTRASKGEFPVDVNVSTTTTKAAGEGEAEAEPKTDALAELGKLLGGKIDTLVETVKGVVGRVEAVEKAAGEDESNRSTQRRNDTSIIDSLAVEDDEGGEDDQTEAQRIARTNDIRRSMGLKAMPLPKANAA